MSRSDNPAGRLLEILERAKKIGNPGHALLGWASVLNVRIQNGALLPEDEADLIHGLMELRRLVDETETSLKKIDGIKHELYLKPFPRIRQMISLGLMNTGFDSVMNHVSEADLTIIEFCSEEISKRHIEKVVDEAQLKEIQGEINALFEEVQTSSLADEIKLFILDELETIRRGIIEYRVRGIKRLREALQTSLGGIFINRELINQENDHEEVSKFARVFYKGSSP